MDSGIPMFAVDTIENYFHDRATTVLLLLDAFVGGMGLLAVILALAGIYAVMAWAVERRLPEIGIRMPIGADRVTC